MSTDESSKTIHVYWSSACPSCPLRANCTTSRYRRLRRWEHEAVLDTMQRRLDEHPGAMRVRRQTVEHTFGTLKVWMGYTHFLTRTLQRLRSLRRSRNERRHVTTDNFSFAFSHCLGRKRTLERYKVTGFGVVEARVKRNERCQPGTEGTAVNTSANYHSNDQPSLHYSAAGAEREAPLAVGPLR